MKIDPADLQAFFDQFWSAKPKRLGANPKFKAFRSFCNAAKACHDPAFIVLAAKRWSEYCDAQKLTGTPYVPMAATWLTQRRFMDMEPEKTDYSAEDAIAAKHGKRWDREKSVYVDIESPA